MGSAGSRPRGHRQRAPRPGGPGGVVSGRRGRVTRAPRSPDIAVIGGGVVGSAVAAFLAEAGLAVRLYERSGVAAGASGRHSGIVQHPFDPVLAALYRATISEYRELADGSPSPFALPARPA